MEEMELEIKGSKIMGKVIPVCLLTLSASIAYSGAMGVELTPSPVNAYIGFFGGAGIIGRTDISQYGTAFFSDAEDGPLAVNAFGTSESSSAGIIGGHIGFAWPNVSMYLPITPAVELEGYYMGGTKIDGHDIDNDTIRLLEHDFLVHYPLKTGVFLVNAILNSNNSIFDTIKPYVGVGIGSALVSVSGATASQVIPLEPGVNHYNSNPDNTVVVFAAQPKIGVKFYLSPRTSIFAEYRFIYLSEANYTFGSTVAPGHVATSPWLVSIKPQYYNMGTIGLDFDL